MSERAPKPGLPNSFWRVLELANDRIADKKKSKRKGSGTLVQQEDLSSKSKPVSGSRVPLAERLAQTDASERVPQTQIEQVWYNWPMQKYDLTILVKSVTGFEEKMEKLAKALGGRASRMVEMGKKQLAYSIAKQTEANYLSWGIELPAEGAVQLEKKLSIDKDILRHLLVKVDK